MLETRDIQGLVRRGYGQLTEARFLLLEVLDGARAREYLRGICGRVNTAHESPKDVELQVAFTYQGLVALGVPESARTSFSRELIEGMDDDIRAESLGDRARTEPSTLAWSDSTVHVLVMLYATESGALDTEERAVRATDAFRVTGKDTRMLRDKKEHFGWRDGLSMPPFLGVPKDGPRTKPQEWWTDPLAPGEIVLGYPNEYKAYSESPTAELADDPANHLIPTADGTHKDLGRNGTYLVYRELIQHVHDLWRYLGDSSREPGTTRAEKAVALGAKMVGRWPGGAPLAVSSGSDDPRYANANTFRYAKDDEIGKGCPIGSHIRRANPRDALGAGRDAPDSELMVRKHQMVRRGRPFGAPVVDSMDPQQILEAPRDEEKRGLHFICLVGNISRQFEFVQRNWLQSANFGGLFKDADPLTATRRRDGNANDDFTCPAVPVRRKYKGLPEFTRLVGGGYFFLPGIAALRFIARHP
jgi:Dyp-type peroxidase family